MGAHFNLQIKRFRFFKFYMAYIFLIKWNINQYYGVWITENHETQTHRSISK